jgi:hypothetical protein
MTTGSRICFVDTTSLDARTIRSTRLNVPIATGSGDNGYMRFRIYDTTVVAGIDWDASAVGSYRKYGYFVIHNLTGTGIVGEYQGTRNCSSSGVCPLSVSGAFSIQPRSAYVMDPAPAGTSGVAFVSFGFAAPSSNVRVYRVQYDDLGGKPPILIEPVLPQ